MSIGFASEKVSSRRRRDDENVDSLNDTASVAVTPLYYQTETTVPGFIYTLFYVSLNGGYEINLAPAAHVRL